MSILYSRLSQSGRSRYNLETSTRRLARIGLSPLHLTHLRLAAEPAMRVQPGAQEQFMNEDLNDSKPAAHVPFVCTPQPAILHDESSLVMPAAEDPISNQLGLLASPPADLFTIQHCIDDQWVSISEGVARARDLEERAEKLAKKNKSVPYRIAKPGAARAVKRWN